jgi:Mg-chelatase subunit ChlD
MLNTFVLTFDDGQLVAIDGSSPSSPRGVEMTKLLTGSAPLELALLMDDLTETSDTSGVTGSADGQGVCVKTNSCDKDDWTGQDCVIDHDRCKAGFSHTTERWEIAAQTNRHGTSDWEAIASNRWFENVLTAPSGTPDPVPPAHCDRVVDIVEDAEPAEQVMVIIDRSGSMDKAFKNKTRLDFAKAGARTYFNAFRNESPPIKVGLIQFNDEAQQIWPEPETMEELTSESYGDLVTALNNIDPIDATAMGRALEESRPAFASLPAGPRVAMMLSDGEHNTGIEPEPVAAELRDDLGVRVFTVPTTDEADRERMSDIARVANGAMFDAQQPSLL